MRAIGDIISLIYRFDAKGARAVLVAAFLGAMLDVVGVASVTPFLSLISNPDLIAENPYFFALYEYLNFNDEREFIVFIGGATILFLIVVAMARAFIAARVTFFIEWQRHNIASALFKNGFYAPLALAGNEHSSVLTSRVFGETDVFIDSAVRPLIELTVHGVLLLALLSMLLVVDFLSTMAILACLLMFFGSVILATQKPIVRSGKNRAAANAERYRSLKEALAAALELRLLGREDVYIARFVDASKKFARSVSINRAIMQIATYAVQALTFAGIIALTIALLGQGNDLGAVVPILGLFLFAGYRIMPAANICYRAFSALRYAKPAVSAIQANLREKSDPPSGTLDQDIVGLDRRVRLRQGIRLQNVYFSYGDDKTPLVIDSIVFPAGKIIGIVGPSGSGKSTLFSLLLGLRAPQRGCILIDGVALDSANMRRWHNSIGFVSQRPFFSDETIGANIALGLPDITHNLKAIKEAARMAHAADFIEALPKAYGTAMGEDGGQLSGGQRQRISIARALYHNPDVLFLDEITSALDAASEKAVSEAIRELRGQKTIFIIAHRPAMIEICDVILKLETGLPVYFGSAHDALQSGNLEIGGGDGSD